MCVFFQYERFFRPEETVVASFYAPIQFPPSPVLCFKENPDTSLRLVANGIVLSCNPDRVILKRVVLSGHPLKVCSKIWLLEEKIKFTHFSHNLLTLQINRRTATIRYMFHNKEDIEYFKPVKLRTRCGRLGHIKESLGMFIRFHFFFIWNSNWIEQNGPKDSCLSHYDWIC